MNPFGISMVSYVLIVVVMVFSDDPIAILALSISASLFMVGGLIIWQLERNKRD